MKFPNFNLCRASLAICLILSSPLAAKADIGDPNGVNNTPDQGWSLWQRWNKISNSNFEIGLSNMDLGGMMDFENACFGEVGTPNTEKKIAETYWFRVNNNVEQFGTGEVEIGCWENGRFKHTTSNTAIKRGWSWEDVYCRRVQTPGQNGLVIRSQPSANSRISGSVPNGGKVNLASVPPKIKTEGDRNWVEISSPAEGWVSNGTNNSQGNLTFCRQ